MDIVYNPANITHPDIGDYIDFACWLWSLRTGVEVEYGGETTANMPSTSNHVLIRLATTTEWETHVLPRIGNVSAATLEVTNGSRLILFNPDAEVTDRHFNLIQHEIGHALRYERPTPFFPQPPSQIPSSHSADPSDLMYGTIFDDNHLGVSDARGVVEFTPFPIVNTPDMRSAVLMPDMDIFHPHFNKQNDPIFNFNTAVWLDYDEDSFATTGHHEWEIGRITGAGTNGQPSEDDYMDGNIIYLGSILSPDVEYQNVQLEVIGASTVRLIWAEIAG